jgi:hypothetical protein
MSHDAARELGSGEYISLTTFRADGTAVPTPVWVALNGTHLYVVTAGDTGKVKRLERNNRVEVSACDLRGTVSGPAHPGTAELLDERDTDFADELLLDKYGWQAQAFGLIRTAQVALRRLLRRASGPDRVGIRIELDQDPQ